jgi:drug/metabolite transporter (DMT)-like permease
MARPRNPAREARLGGEVALFASATTFAFVNLCVKLASRTFSGYFVSGVRFAVGALLCLAVLLVRYRGGRLRRPGAVLLRGLFGAASMVCSYLAISMTGPGRGALLSNTYPLFVAIFGPLMFGERFSIRTLLSIAVCTAGAVLVMEDGSGASLAGDLVAIASAVLAGLGVNFVRRASSAGENPFVLYLSPCVFGLPILAAAPLPHAAGPTALFFLLFVALGSFAAQALMSVGYRSVEAGRGSVVFYWETALTVVLGFLLGGERFNWRFLVGFVVILGGLWLNRGGRPAESGARPGPAGAAGSSGAPEAGRARN